MKTLKFLANQNSVNVPDVVEVKNDFGSIAWTRVSSGYYKGIGNFTGYDVYCPQHQVNYTNNNDEPFTFKLSKESDTEIAMASITPGFSAEDNLLTNIFAEVYFKKQ